MFLLFYGKEHPHVLEFSAKSLTHIFIAAFRKIIAKVSTIIKEIC